MPLITPDDLRKQLGADLPGAVASVHPVVEGLPAFLETGDLLIEADFLPRVAVYVRDVLGYTYLSDIVAVDYLDYQLFELVYRFYHLEGGRDLVIKVRVPRDNPSVPSLTPFWPGADLNEREAFDLFGITFTGHPYLKRIYMWDELDGHPMRKDFPKQGDKYLGDES
ncbi:MAG: NADH-quinone oxidoreductase subunit C [Chloroflexaceae bacterium]|nr:NADH-quinone oxidoreductase subunit C [Chloroflexaceae bacterium]